MSSRLASVLGSAAFRVVLVSVAAFVLAAGVIVAVLFWQMNEILTERAVAALSSEVGALQADARTASLPALVEAVDQRSRTPGPMLYYLTDATGRRLAGNLPAAPAGIVPGSRGGVFEYGNGAGGHAVGVAVDLGAQGRLIVGRDIEDQRSLAAEVRRVFLIGFGGLTLAGLVAGLVISRFVLGRIDAINATSRSIMAGDLSQRIPLQGSGDELDDLAANLNAMLDRIEQLMSGLREISDNIAHDLKTPLTRLRAGVEAALRDPRGAEVHREALERTIEEADGLIRTFNALLLIARLEAGALEGSTERFDLSRLVRDVADLYEPVAELAGLKLTVETGEGQLMHGNRQLISQATANLIDNATKYSAANRRNVEDSGIRVVVQSVGDRYEISVADRGPGIAEADRERVLKRFVRLETSRTAPGTGLGLSLVAAVARLHGGAVRLEDNAPGLRVVLALPKGPAAP